MTSPLLAVLTTVAVIGLSSCAIKPIPLTTDEVQSRVKEDRAVLTKDQEPVSGPIDLYEAMARAALFGETPSLPPQEHHELEFADQGREGFGLVQSAHREGHPHAMVFVDMRVPSGWDSLETIEHLWHVDPDIEIVICTAYSDHPWEDVSRRTGNTDKLLILMKPFNSIEVVQLANLLTTKWNLTRSVKLQIESLVSCVSSERPNCAKRTAAFKKISPGELRRL
jgi:DNA-binding LytR/AlgR family response regulator